MEDPEIEIDRKIDDAEIDREIVATLHVIEGGTIRATGNETLENPAEKMSPTTKQNRKEDGRKRKETKKTPMTKRREGRSENK